MIDDNRFRTVPLADPVQERIDQHEKTFRLLKNEQENDRYEDSDEELEPFAPHISNTPFPQGFWIPHVPTFEGKTDPCSHLSTFNTIMRASNVGYELRCMLFPTSLAGPAKSWFEKYKRHSITSWVQLYKDFKKQFRAMMGVRPEASTLTNVRQQPGETLKSYLTRFNLEVARARNADDSGHFMAVQAGVMPGSALWDDMQRKLVRSITEFNRRAQRFVNVEEARSTLNVTSQPETTTINVNSASTSADPAAPKPVAENPSKRKKNEGSNPEAEGGKKKKGERYFSVYRVYTELNESRENIYLANENRSPLGVRT